MANYGSSLFSVGKRADREKNVEIRNSGKETDDEFCH
jgi:hypothetical protein